MTSFQRRLEPRAERAATYDRADQADAALYPAVAR